MYDLKRMQVLRTVVNFSKYHLTTLLLPRKTVPDAPPPPPQPPEIEESAVAQTEVFEKGKPGAKAAIGKPGSKEEKGKKHEEPKKEAGERKVPVDSKEGKRESSKEKQANLRPGSMEKQSQLPNISFVSEGGDPNGNIEVKLVDLDGLPGLKAKDDPFSTVDKEENEKDFFEPEETLKEAEKMEVVVTDGRGDVFVVDFKSLESQIPSGSISQGASGEWNYNVGLAGKEATRFISHKFLQPLNSQVSSVELNPKLNELYVGSHLGSIAVLSLNTEPNNPPPQSIEPVVEKEEDEDEPSRPATKGGAKTGARGAPASKKPAPEPKKQAPPPKKAPPKGKNAKKEEPEEEKEVVPPPPPVRPKEIGNSHNGPVKTLAFSPDSKLLLSYAEDNRIKVWDIEKVGMGSDATCTKMIQSAPKNINKMVLTEDLKYLILFLNGFTSVQVWSFEELALLFEIPFLLSGSESQREPEVTTSSGSLRKAPKQKKGGVISSWFLLAEPQPWLIVGGEDEKIRYYSLESGKEEEGEAFPHEHSEKVLKGLGYSPDSGILMTASNSEVFLWDFEKKQVYEKITEEIPAIYPEGIVGLSLTMDGSHAAITSRNTISVFNLGTKTEIWRVSPEKERIQAACLSVDGKIIVEGTGSDYGVRVWNVEKKQLFFEEKLEGWVNDVVMSPDAKKVAVCSYDNSVRIFATPFNPEEDDKKGKKLPPKK